MTGSAIADEATRMANYLREGIIHGWGQPLLMMDCGDQVGPLVGVDAPVDDTEYVLGFFSGTVVRGNDSTGEVDVRASSVVAIEWLRQRLR